MSLTGLYVEPHSSEAALGYPPCQQGVDLLFAIQPGQTLDARAMALDTFGDAPHRIQVSLFRNFAPAALLFKEAKAQPAPGLFHLQLQCNVDPPLGKEVRVRVGCYQNNGATVVTIDPA